MADAGVNGRTLIAAIQRCATPPIEKDDPPLKTRYPQQTSRSAPPPPARTSTHTPAISLPNTDTRSGRIMKIQRKCGGAHIANIFGEMQNANIFLGARMSL